MLLVDMPAKDKDGFTQILVTTPSQNKNYVNFDFVNQHFIETEQSYILNNIAHTGYLAGKTTSQKVIVLGKTAKTGSIISTRPIGVARFTAKENVSDWHIYAEIDADISCFDDFVLNNFDLKNELQNKLKMLEEIQEPTLIWYDEGFLEFKISQAL